MAELESPADVLRRASEQLHRDGGTQGTKWMSALATSWVFAADLMDGAETFECQHGGRSEVVSDEEGVRHDWTLTLTAARTYLGEVPDVA